MPGRRELATVERLPEGVCLTTGEADGAALAFGARDGVSLAEGKGKAKVGDGDGEALGDAPGDPLGDGDAAGLGEGVGVGVGVGVGGGGIMFTHLCIGLPAPPISFTSASQRALILSRSGGPKGVSAVPGKMR